MKKAELLKLIEALPDDAEIGVGDADYGTADEPLIVKADSRESWVTEPHKIPGNLYVIQTQ